MLDTNIEPLDDEYYDSSADADSELFERLTFEVDGGQGLLRVDRYLLHKLSNISRSKIQAAIEAGNLLVNQKIVKSSYKVKPTDVLDVLIPRKPREHDLTAENIPLTIVYEDDELMVVNKPAGMVVHPAYNNWSGTLVNALVYHLGQLPENQGQSIRPGLVHRIDKDTSGLLVIAKTDYAMAFLAKQFFDHTTQRTYHALVWGNPNPESGTINVNLGRHPKDRRITYPYPDGSQGQTAITHYKILKNFGYVSLIECKLETGRTHQIRAHMRYIGCPIFSDATYGGDKLIKGPAFSKFKAFVENCFQLVPRQALHAKTLGFIHPRTKQPMHFDSAIPADMQAAIDKWEKYSAYLSDSEV